MVCDYSSDMRTMVLRCRVAPNDSPGAPPLDRDPVLRFTVNQGEQERAVFVSGLADGGDIDGRVVLDGTLVLANAAADALHGVDIRPFEFDRRAPAVGHLDVASEDCLRTDRADFLTDHATGVHRPGKATALVVECGPGFDWAFSLERPDPQLFDDRDLADGPSQIGRAHV